jgi:WD40 repeat protein
MKICSHFVMAVLHKHRGLARLLWSSILCLIISACGSNLPRQAPDVVNEDAHSGGSTLAFSSDSRMAASGGWSGYVRIWDMPGGTNKVTWRAHHGQVNGIVFLHNGSQLLTGGYDKKMALWSIDGKQLRSISTGSPITHLISAPAHNLILTAHDDGVARQWRLSDFKLIAETRQHQGALTSVAMHIESGRMASSGTDGKVWVWNSSSNPQLLEDSLTDVRTLAFSPDGQYLYGGTWFNLYRWRFADGSRKSISTEHKGIIKQIQFIPNSNYLASISRQTDSAVLFLNADSGATVRRFNSHDLCGAAISVSPDGRYLVTTSDDASVRFWNLLNPT